MPTHNFLSVVVIVLSCVVCGANHRLCAQQRDDAMGIAESFGEEFAEDFEEEEEDELESDRDSFTRSPRLMTPCRTMAEVSYTFLDQNAENEGHLFPDLLIRHGVSELLELRLGWTYEIGKFDHLAPIGAEPVEEGLINYGAKVCMTSACGVIPDSSLVITGYSPTSGDSNDTDLSLEYIFGWKQDGWQIDGMVRWFSLAEEDDRFTEWAPSIVVKRGVLGGRANVHVEYFSLHSAARDEDYDQYYVGPGAHYLLTPNLEIGARVFWGMGDDSAEFISNAGLAARF